MDRQQPYQFPFARFPAVRILLLLSAGIIADYYTEIPTYIWAGTLLLNGTGFLLFQFGTRNSLYLRYYQLSILMYLVTLFLFGAGWHSLTAGSKTSASEKLLDAYAWESVMFSGKVYQSKTSSSGSLQLDIAVDTTLFDHKHPWKKAYHIRAIEKKTKLALLPQITLGDRVTIMGTIYPSSRKRNPHDFDYASYLNSIGIHHQVGIDSIITIRSGSTPRLDWISIRKATMYRIEDIFSHDTAPLAKALLIGYKQELHHEEKLAFSRTGLSHIMAVSGLHVGFILAPFWFVIPYFWTFKSGRLLGLAFIVLLLIFYAGLTGFSSSVMRASLTGGFILYGRLFNKVRDGINLTALSAIIILLVNPSALFQIGFQLSFSAVFIILLCLPTLQAFLPPWVRFRWYGVPIMLIIISILVQGGLYPLLGYYFGEFSLVGPLVNALVVPFLTILIPYALMLLPLSVAVPGLTKLLNIPCDYFLTWLNRFVQSASSWDISWLTVQVESPVVFLIWITAVILICSLTVPQIKWKATILFLVVLCAQQGLMLADKIRDPKLEITVFDVGQGDAVLIKTPLGKHFMIDTGRWSPGYNSARYHIIPHLRREGIKQLDAVFLSHPHSDHIGGIVELIDYLPILRIYHSGYIYHSQLYQTYRTRAFEKGIPLVPVSAGDIIDIDRSMRIFAYGPQPMATYSEDPNEHSLVLELMYGKSQFLFTGDAGSEQERRLLENFGPLLDTDFLKVGHHGSRTSSSLPFLKETTPHVAVISVAKHNRYRHPHREAVTRLRESGAVFYFTSLEGALQFHSDGVTIDKYHWQNWR